MHRGRLRASARRAGDEPPRHGAGRPAGADHLAALKLALKTKRLPLTPEDEAVRQDTSLKPVDRFSSGFSGLLEKKKLCTLMQLGWFSVTTILNSRFEYFGSWYTFLIATTWLSAMIRALYTTPKVPCPITFTHSYLPTSSLF